MTRGGPLPKDSKVKTLRHRKGKDRKGRRKGAWDWTLTNIGAAISIMGLMLAIMVYVQYIFTGVILFILMIPALCIVIFGYALIVKDHLDNKKKARSKKGKAAKASEEE